MVRENDAREWTTRFAMPELVADGPTIPVHLLNEMDSGRVVFFCGAGVSAGPGSGLPGFGDLVAYVYAANHLEPDAIEREALDLEEGNRERRRPNLDRALGLLERPERLGAQLRRTVIERLSKPPRGSLAVHEALIELSRNERGVRLITTNFDNRFVEAGLPSELVDSAPKLPVPKPHSWSTLVHLHGRILPNDDGSELVLTAADFGRAYLTEQWAARFVTELFRAFTVVFVGYSVGDPVVSYMVDALAAERSRGGPLATAYAFAAADGPPGGKAKARDGWRAKNVEPILYDSRNGHVLLADTLIEWARLRRDPLHARSQIAINEITRMPAGPEDPVVERVVWALQDPVAAKALADEAPIVADEDFPKLETWLDAFAEKGLLSCAPANESPGVENTRATVENLVDNGLERGNPHSLDMTRVQLARWLARHLHVPQLLAWVLRNGGHLHPGVRQQVERSLAEEGVGIPPRLRFLWSVLLDAEAAGPWSHLWTAGRYVAATSESERRRIEDEALASIAPRLSVRAGPSSMLEFRQGLHGEAAPMSSIDACGHVELVLGGAETWRWVEKMLKSPDVLARHAETLTGYLERALGLGEEDDDVYSDSSLYRPSIAENSENGDPDDWAHLIDLVRDSYFALAEANRARGDHLLRRWVMSPHGLFRRLALHALTENGKSDIRMAERLLVAGRKRGVWEPELRREVLRFFRVAGTRLPRSLRAGIVRVIHGGPTRRPRKPVSDHWEIVRREIAVRLRELSASGARLDKRSRALVEGLERDTEGGYQDRDEFSSWRGDVRFVGDEEFAPKALVQGSVDDVVGALRDETISTVGFRGLAAKRPVKAACALRRLADGGKWPSGYWRELLWFLAGRGERPENQGRLVDCVARTLAGAPARMLDDIAGAMAGFVEGIAKRWGTDREDEFRILWTKGWSGGEERGMVDPVEPLTDALNSASGKLAEAALVRVGKYEPTAGGGLPVPVRGYLEAIGGDGDRYLGRVILVTRLHYLFAVDRDWVGQYLLPRLDVRSSKEAWDLWTAYGWSPSLGPDLLRALKGSFLGFLRDPEERGEKRRNLMRLFVTVCLEAPGELTGGEIRDVFEAMSEEGLQTVLQVLMSRLRGDGAQRGKIWREGLYPWLREYWPRTGARSTAATSEAILEVLAECGEGFPLAAEWSLDYLRPVAGRGLYRLGQSGHAERYPAEMVRVLDRVVAEDALQGHQKHELQSLLDALAKAAPELLLEQRFRRLHGIAVG